LQLDIKTKHFFSGPEKGPGSKYKWQCTNKAVGKGSVTIVSSTPYDSIEVIMDFGENGKSIGKFVLLKENARTIVIWSLSSDLGMNPLSRWIGLFSDKLIGPDLERGLANLDQVITESRTINGYKILDYEVPERILISARDTASSFTMTLKLSKMFSKLSAYLKLKNLPPTGAPIAIFQADTLGVFNIEAALPISSKIDVPKGMTCESNNLQKSIMVQYFGPYRLIAKAYKALDTYIKQNEVSVSGAGWEEYIINPASEADTNKWQTNIYFPVK